MKTLLPVRIVFGLACAYEVALGLAFIFAGPSIFRSLGIEPPNHWGYLHFSAALLLVFGLMFFQVARDPVGRAHLIPYGVLLKACYVATVAWHWYDAGVPTMWKVFALADVVFALAFLWSLAPIRAATTPPPPGAMPHTA